MSIYPSYSTICYFIKRLYGNARGVRSVDVKGGEIGLFKTLINKGLPDIELFSLLLCRRC